MKVSAIIGGHKIAGRLYPVVIQKIQVQREKGI